MRTKVRFAQPPARQTDWQGLMKVVLQRSQQQGRPTQDLQEAFRQGQSEQHLRRLGIISLTDIDREFPPA